ncbi:hypothetical protein VTJ04DRAFT_1050 [Mycothermus thermophilus]|uniref:uncharacterized protein n=1 Tax=Humicola insolens TaxID=85995 RepID=UPI003741FA35
MTFQPFTTLPTELILLIGSHCDTPTLSRLSRCNKRLHGILFRDLWLTGSQRPGKPALYHAIESGSLWLAERALSRYREISPAANGLLDGTSVLFDTFCWAGYPRTMPASYHPRSPLMHAIICEWEVDQLRVLVKGGCSVNVRRRGNYDRFPAPGGGLHHTCVLEECEYHSKCPRKTSTWWPRPARNGFVCTTALHVAIEGCRTDVLDFLLSECQAERGLLQWPNEEPIPGNCVLPLSEYCYIRWVASRRMRMHAPTIRTLAAHGVNVWWWADVEFSLAALRQMAP